MALKSKLSTAFDGGELGHPSGARPCTFPINQLQFGSNKVTHMIDALGSALAGPSYS